MFAIAFDLVVQDTQRLHPKGVAQAYTDVLQHQLFRSGPNGQPLTGRVDNLLKVHS